MEAQQRVGVGGHDRAQVDDAAVGGDDVGLPVRRVARARPPGVVGASAFGHVSHRGSSGSRPWRGKTARRVSRIGEVDALGGAVAPRGVRGARVLRHRGGQLPPGQRGGVRRPARRDRGVARDVAVEHGGDQVRPRPRHHPEQAVPAAAGGEPAPARGVGGQLAEPPVDLAVPVDGEPEVGQRVFAVGVGAALGDQQLRAERREQRRHDRVERAQPARIARARRQREVDGVARGLAVAVLARPARAGPQRHGVLVQRDREHPGVVVERRLHAVAVVDVDVDVGDALEAVVQQPGDGDRAVVVDAEARGPVGHRVVQPARDVDGALGPPLGDLARRRQRAAADQRAGLVHPEEDRVVVGAEAVPDPERRLRRGLDRARKDGTWMRWISSSGAGSGTIGSTPSSDPQLGGEAHGQVEPDRVERVVVAQVVGQELGCPHHSSAGAHGCDRLTDRHPSRRVGSDPTTTATRTRGTARPGRRASAARRAPRRARARPR